MMNTDKLMPSSLGILERTVHAVCLFGFPRSWYVWRAFWSLRWFPWITFLIYLLNNFLLPLFIEINLGFYDLLFHCVQAAPKYLLISPHNFPGIAPIDISTCNLEKSSSFTEEVLIKRQFSKSLQIEGVIYQATQPEAFSSSARVPHSNLSRHHKMAWFFFFLRVLPPPPPPPQEVRPHRG